MVTALAVWVAVVPSVRPSEPVRIDLVDRAGASSVEVRGIGPERLAELERQPPADWFEVLAIFTDAASGGSLPPVLGSHAIEAGVLRFTPRFPFVAGETYVARWRDPVEGDEHTARLTLARPELPNSTTLRAVYPSVAAVPENLLRIYLQFSAPMGRGAAHDHIRLVDLDSAEVVEGAFVAPEHELWSPDGTRLTLFFDPGRIKRGVGPNLDVGPPLTAGRRYRLEIDHELADARGVPLVRDYFKELDVLPPDRNPPRTEDWLLEPPTEPGGDVRLTFPEPLDRALLEGLLTVIGPGDETVAGRSTVAAGESVWSFRPDEQWRAGVYRVRVPTILEDLAGNSLRRPFEVVLEGGPGPRDDDEVAYLDLPFAVRK